MSTSYLSDLSSFYNFSGDVHVERIGSVNSLFFHFFQGQRVTRGRGLQNMIYVLWGCVGEDNGYF